LVFLPYSAMISQKMLAITLALAAAVVQADNCETWSTGTKSYSTHKFKTTLTNLKCTSKDFTALSCQTCCEEKEICAKTTNQAVACDTPADNAKDPAKLGAAATAATAKTTTCCSAKEKCSSYGCPAGYKSLAGKADHKCAMMGTIKCSTVECCEIETKTCDGFNTAYANALCKEEVTLTDGTKVDSGKWVFDTAEGSTAVTQANYFAKCCKAKDTCIGRKADASPAKVDPMNGKCKTDAKKEYDHSKKDMAVKADLSDWEAVCCTTIAVCKDFTCSAGAGFLGEKGAGVTDTTECLSMGAKSPACSAANCCKPDPDICSARVAAGCASGKYYDISKATVAAKDATEFKANCCTDQATCEAAQSYVIPIPEGAVGGSPRQHEPVVALVLAVIGALTVRM